MWERASEHRRVIALLAVVLVAVAFVAFGGLAWVRGDGNVEELLTDTGVIGPLIFIGFMWMTQPLGVPGMVYMAPAGIIWSAPLAISLSWLGNMGASLIAFVFARWVARDWAQERIPSRMERFHDRLHPEAIRPVILLRLVFGQLPPADWLLGVTRVSTRTFLFGTAIGIVPGIVVIVIAGGTILGAITDLPAAARWIAAGVIVAALVATRVLRSRRSRV